ncbi:MAG: head-tail adaptor protein [Pseudomonadota bacterium]
MIGKLKNTATLMKPVRTDDGGGGASVVWSQYAEVWAALTLLSSTRDFIGGSERRLARAAIEIRSRTDISFMDRFRIAGADYDVVSIESDDRNPDRVTLIGEEATT